MRELLTLIVLSSTALTTPVLGNLADIAPVAPPNRLYSASVRLMPAKDLGQEVANSTLEGAKVAVVLLQDARAKKPLDRLVVPDLDDTDYRNSIELVWSPDGRVLIVQTQVGQLSQFTLYHVQARHLAQIKELPVPKRLVIHSQHQKSRGGISIDKWLGPDRFVATDTVSEAQYTYRITKRWQLETIAAKPIEP